MDLYYTDSRPDVDLPYTDKNIKKLKGWVGEKGIRLKRLLITDPAKVDRDIVLAAVRQNGLALQYAFLGLRRRPEDSWREEDLRDDRKVVLAAVMQNGLALTHAHDTFLKDREVVLAAVMQNGLALEHVHSTFRKDREVVLAAVIQNSLAIKFASPKLQNDIEVIARAFRTRLSRSSNTRSKKTK